MPITVEQGTPIPQAAGAPPTKQLNITYQKQEQTCWCWAACGQMVLGLFGVNVAQCDLASKEFGARCCAYPSSSVCNNYGIVKDPYDFYDCHCLVWNGYFSLERVKSEIDAGRPIEVYYSWSGGGSHVALVVGYNDPDILIVYDPAEGYGPGPRRYSVVVAAYGLGAWTGTYGGFSRQRVTA